MEKSIYELNLHETIFINEKDSNLIEILRVPNGWIYTTFMTDKKTSINGTAVFVPFHDEFINKKKSISVRV